MDIREVDMGKLCNKCNWFENEKCIHIEGSCLKIESDGRRPESVEFSSMEEDAKRRDLTINGLFFDPITEEIFDFVGGQKDINHGIIQFIGDAKDRIDEDRLRILRAIRFSARFDFDMESDTLNAIKKNAHRINDVSIERIKMELDKMLLIRKPSEAFNMLHETGLLKHILPEVDVLWSVEQSPRWHAEGNVGIHTMMVLDAVRAKTNKLHILWSALLHDVGKKRCFTIEDGLIRAHGHAGVGAEIVETILRRLKSSNQERKAAIDLVANHMKIKDVAKMRKSKLRRLVAQNNLEDLIILGISDSESAYCTIPELEAGKFDFVEVLKNFKDELKDVVELPEPFVTGKDLISLGFKPGPVFKEILDEVAELQLGGEITHRNEAMAYVRTLVG